LCVLFVAAAGENAPRDISVSLMTLLLEKSLLCWSGYEMTAALATRAIDEVYPF